MVTLQYVISLCEILRLFIYCPNDGSDSWRAEISNFASILGQIGPKMDISGIFKDPFQPKCTETDLKNPRFVPFGANLTHFGAKAEIPVYRCQLIKVSIDLLRIKLEFRVRFTEYWVKSVLADSVAHIRCGTLLCGSSVRIFIQVWSNRLAVWCLFLICCPFDLLFHSNLHYSLSLGERSYFLY